MPESHVVTLSLVESHHVVTGCYIHVTSSITATQATANTATHLSHAAQQPIN